MKPKTIVFDIDGTLVDVSSLRHLVQEGPKNFDAFHQGAVNCPPISRTAWAVKNYDRGGLTVIQVTARAEKYRATTKWWLAKHEIPSDGLFMRANGDYRSDYEVKRDILDKLLEQYDIVEAWDDNPSIVQLWSEYAIPCVVVPGWQDD